MSLALGDKSEEDIDDDDDDSDATITVLMVGQLQTNWVQTRTMTHWWQADDKNLFLAPGAGQPQPPGSAVSIYV